MTVKTEFPVNSIKIIFFIREPDDSAIGSWSVPVTLPATGRPATTAFTIIVTDESDERSPNVGLESAFDGVGTERRGRGTAAASSHSPGGDDLRRPAEK